MSRGDEIARSLKRRAATRKLVSASAVFVCVAGLFQSCTFFAGKPALPKHASVQEFATPTAETDYAALVTNADIIYFPGERAASGARAEPAALLLDALQKSGARFAIAWDVIDGAQQPLLEEMAGKKGAEREELIARLNLSGSGRAREHCRAVLRESGFTGIRHLGVACPDVLLGKVRTAERLTPDEEMELPNGFATPPGGFGAYAEWPSAAGEQGPRTLAFFRAAMVRQQYAAEKIVRHFRERGVEGKLLVFLRRGDLEAGQGVPRYVAQKLQLRQLVLDSSTPISPRPKLLTRRTWRQHPSTGEG